MKRNKEFTIIELLVVLVITVVISTVLYKFQSNTSQNFRQGQWREEMNASANILLEFLKQDIKSMMNINENVLISSSNWNDEIKKLSAEFPVESKNNYIFKIPYSSGDDIEVKNIEYEYDSSSGILKRISPKGTYILGEKEYEFIVEDFRIQMYGTGPYFMRVILKLLKEKNNVDTQATLELTTSVGIRYLNSAIDDPNWKPVQQNLQKIKY